MLVGASRLRFLQGVSCPVCLSANFTHEAGCVPSGPVLNCTPLGHECVPSIFGLHPWARSVQWPIHPWGNYGKCFVSGVVYGLLLHAALLPRNRFEPHTGGP